MFCEKFMPDYLMNSQEYKNRNFARALEETFVELDYLLLNEEGWDKMKGIALAMK